MMIIVFDSNCTICTQIKTVLEQIDFDQQFEFRPLNDDSIYQEYPGLNYWSARKTIHLIDNNGDIFNSEQAVLKIIEHLRYIKHLKPILVTKIGLQLTKISYQLLNNYRLSKIKNCTDCRP